MNLYTIHNSRLTSRDHILKETIKRLEEACRYASRELRVIPVPLEEIPLIALQDRIDYKPTGDDTIDRNIQPLSSHAIMNLLTHQRALQMISGGREDEIHLVLEDDAVVFPEYQESLQKLIKHLYQDKDWSMVFLGMGGLDTSDRDLLRPIKKVVTTIVSKEAYCIRPFYSKILLKEFDTIRLSYRFLLSHVIFKRPVGIFIPRDRITLDGSKLGLVPSSIHSNNILVYNNDFTQLWTMLTNASDKDVPAKLLDQAKAVFEKLQDMESPDIYTLYGLYLLKARKYKAAIDILEKALELYDKKQGFIDGRSNLLNNLVQAYRFIQSDLDEVISYPSKVLSY